MFYVFGDEIMEQEIWESFNHDNGSNITLIKTSAEEYEIYVTTSFGHACEAIKKLDRKQLKDLFNALGNELDAWS
jgi:hypothetical protein